VVFLVGDPVVQPSELRPQQTVEALDCLPGAGLTGAQERAATRREGALEKGDELSLVPRLPEGLVVEGQQLGPRRAPYDRSSPAAPRMSSRPRHT
jgi:hypothetical protein